MNQQFLWELMAFPALNRASQPAAGGKGPNHIAPALQRR